MKRLVMSGVAMLALLPVAASAANYQCRLPTVTTAEFKNDSSSVTTDQDNSVVFVVRVARDGKQAFIEGATYSTVKGLGYLAFIGMLDGVSNGIDVLTIYDAKGDGGQFSVETRNMSIRGKPVASQMVGACAAL